MIRIIFQPNFSQKRFFSFEVKRGHLGSNRQKIELIESNLTIYQDAAFFCHFFENKILRSQEVTLGGNLCM